MPEPTLQSCRALVTGAGRGLGRGIAAAFAAAGAETVLVSRSEDELAAATAEIAAAGGSASWRTCDVTDVAAVAGLVAELPAFDILVNNAGTNAPQPFCEVEPETFDRLVELNLRAAFFTTQAVTRRMIETGEGGAIVNVSSQMGHVGAPNRTVYCATKHALEGLTKALAVELAPHRIRVNSVAPSYVATAMTEPYFADEAFRADVLGRIPLGRLGSVEEVASAVVHLASPDAAFITGTSLLVDGGYTAQ